MFVCIKDVPNSGSNMLKHWFLWCFQGSSCHEKHIRVLSYFLLSFHKMFLKVLSAQCMPSCPRIVPGDYKQANNKFANNQQQVADLLTLTQHVCTCMCDNMFHVNLWSVKSSWLLLMTWCQGTRASATTMMTKFTQCIPGVQGCNVTWSFDDFFVFSQNDQLWGTRASATTMMTKFTQCIPGVQGCNVTWIFDDFFVLSQNNQLWGTRASATAMMTKFTQCIPGVQGCNVTWSFDDFFVLSQNNQLWGTRASATTMMTKFTQWIPGVQGCNVTWSFDDFFVLISYEAPGHQQPPWWQSSLSAHQECRDAM